MLILLYIAQWANAQNITSEMGHELHTIKNTWLISPNAAALGFANFKSYGITSIGYQHTEGNLKRAQQGDSNGGLLFSSQRYNQLNNGWYTWGQFEFQTNREKNKNWSNVFNPYNDSPYIFGDSVKATYDKQLFDLKAKIAKRVNDSWGFGLALNYHAGDMSRIRDPRTRTFLANYSAHPSVLFVLSPNHQVAANVGLGFEKEKMPSVVTIQTDPKIDYYFFLGNENAYAVLDGYKGFSRQYTTLNYSIGVQHIYKNEKSELYNALSYLKRNQQVLGSERESPGSFNSTQYAFDSKFYSTFSDWLFTYDLKSYFKTGAANEFLQERIETRNPETGVTSREWVTLFAYENRYISNSYNVNFRTDIRRLMRENTEYLWKAGLLFNVDGFANRYYMPYSVFESRKATAGLYGAYRIFEKGGHSILLNANAAHAFSMLNNVEFNDISLSTSSIFDSNYEKATKRVAAEIIMTDASFWAQDTWSYLIALNYTFPIQLKSNKLTGELKAFYQNTDGKSLGDRRFMGLSFGIVTF